MMGASDDDLFWVSRLAFSIGIVALFIGGVGMLFGAETFALENTTWGALAFLLGTFFAIVGVANLTLSYWLKDRLDRDHFSRQFVNGNTAKTLDDENENP